MKFLWAFSLVCSGCVYAQELKIEKEKYHYSNVAQDTFWGYANVVKTGNVLYLSGVTSAGSFAEQVQKIYSRIESNLKRYGATFQNVVKENVFTTSMDSMQFYNYIRKPFYKEDYPAATWVQISRMFVADRMLEVEVVAQLPETNSNNTWPGQLIEGTWMMPNKNGAIGETWKKISENYYQNKGFIIKGKDTIRTEQVALRKTADGIFYTSTVEDQNNKQPVSFKLSSACNNIFIFENREHDFPKRIVYEFTDSTTLHAYIDDGIKGKKRQDFYYKKVK
jgi:2-iminobutanoate/2-iminopropanoate deaminase